MANQVMSWQVSIEFIGLRIAKSHWSNWNMYLEEYTLYQGVAYTHRP